MNADQNDIDSLVNEIDAKSNKERRILTMLLDKYSQTAGKVFAIRSEMGYTLEETGQRVRIPSFTVVQSLDWVGRTVKMGSQMPFMQGHIDKKGVLKVDESIADSVKQRAPDWTRQAAIAAYLAHDKRRKFGTVVAVLNPPWVDDLKHENWAPVESGRRALKSAYQFEALDTKGRLGLLDLDDSLIYALDGQHRVMGIRGIQELQEHGFLSLKNREGMSKSGRITRDEFMSQFNLDTAELQSLLGETITLELIPAVLAGEAAEQSSQRVRSVFITINAYAQKTGKGEEALLDESDGFAIVARKAGTLHPLFQHDRINWKSSSLPRRTRWYTTLDTLRKIAQVYLPQVAYELTSAWEPQFKGQVPIRPEEADIERAKDAYFDFLDRMRDLPVYKGLESGDDLDEIRLFPSDFDSEEDRLKAKGNLLLRPVGQSILAMAVGQLVHEGLELDKIFEKLSKWDRLGGFAQHDPSSIWYGVTFDTRKRNMNTRTNEPMAANLLKYMIRGAEENEREILKKFVVEARIAGGTVDKPKWENFSGSVDTYDPENPGAGVDLPLPIDRL